MSARMTFASNVTLQSKGETDLKTRFDFSRPMNDQYTLRQVSATLVKIQPMIVRAVRPRATSFTIKP